MKTRTALILLALIATATVSCANHAGHHATKPESFPHLSDFDREFEHDFPGEQYTIYPVEEVTTDLLINRAEHDEYIIEVSTGTVTSESGDGKLDLPEPYNYISYRRVPFPTDPGDRIITYSVYELHSNGEDDIIARYDYLLSEDAE